MIAFHGKQEVKDLYLARIRAHRAADELVKGTYWEHGKGCAVGCTIHSGMHANYESELGIPRILARLEDRLFERLPNDVAMEWPERFLSSINVGADLSKVWAQWVIWLLGDPEHGTLKYCNEAGAAATRKVIELYQHELDGGKVSTEEWEATDSDAWRSAAAGRRSAAAAADAADAAYSAAYAADAAARAAAAADAAYSAAAAAAAATTCRDAAAATTCRRAAADSHYVLMADKLIKLMSAA